VKRIMTTNDNIKTSLSEAQVYESMGLYTEALGAYENILSEEEPKDSEIITEIKDHIVRLEKKLADDSEEDAGGSEFSRESLDQIKTHTPDEKDIAPILDRASVFLEKGLYEEAADEYAMLFSIGYSFGTVIPPIIDFLMTICPYGQVGREVSRVIDKFNLQKDELAEITVLFGKEIAKRAQYSSAAGLFEKAKGLDPGNENIEKMYKEIVSQFMAEPRSIYLIRRTRLTDDQLAEALVLSFNEEKSLCSVLISNNYIDRDRLLRALSDYHKNPAVEFDSKLIPPKRITSRLKKAALLSQEWVPLEWNDTGARVVVENPEDTYQIEQIKRILSVDDVQFCPGIQEDIELLIEHFFEQGKKLEEIEAEKDPGNVEGAVVMDIVEMLEQKNGWSSEQKISIRPQLISAELMLKEQNGKQDSLLVRLKDSPDHGLGMLISSEEYKRLNKIKDGDMLNDIIFYTGWAMVRTKSVVRNVTRIREGKDKGQYFVEIESENVI